MKVYGYVICQPINTWGSKKLDPWHPFTHTFGTTAQESWIRFLGIQPSHDEWDRRQQAWINRGYCPKITIMEIHL